MTESEASGRLISYHFADAGEGVELLLGNTDYFDGFTRNDLEFRMEKKDASLEEYLDFTAEQVMDFTDAEKAVIDRYMEDIESILTEKQLVLPPLDEIVFIRTTMNEEDGVDAYTHGTQIYWGADYLDLAFSEPDAIVPEVEAVLCHELFHCLTRCNPDFRVRMYSIIHFTVQDEDFPFPPSVEEYYISNPDVEHHNSRATFLINGKPTDCFVAFVTTRQFEHEGDSFFDCGTAALVPIDGTDIWYSPDQAENFDEVFGTNTDYVIDPEECMADNFSFALVYGSEGPEGNGYPNPEIIDAILADLHSDGAAHAGNTYIHDPRENPEALKDIVENPEAVYGFSPDPQSQRLGTYAQYDWTDPEFVAGAKKERIAYHESLESMTDILYRMREEGASTEEMARAISAERNRLRLAAYADDPDRLAEVKESNLKTYGHEDGPTPEEMYEKYGSWTAVIQKAFSTNMGMDACCGLYDEYYSLYVELGYFDS